MTDNKIDKESVSIIFKTRTTDFVSNRLLCQRFGRAVVVGEKLRLGRAGFSLVECSLTARIIEDVLASQAVAANRELVGNSVDVAVGRSRQTQTALQNRFCAEPSASLQRRLREQCMNEIHRNRATQRPKKPPVTTDSIEAACHRVGSTVGSLGSAKSNLARSI